MLLMKLTATSSKSLLPCLTVTFAFYLFILVHMHFLLDSHVYYLSLFMFCMFHMKYFDLKSVVTFVFKPVWADSRGRLVAGSFQGKTGHADGTPNEARFNHPRGVTMDDKGNIYVADTLNLAIRKIGDSGMSAKFSGCSEMLRV